MTRARLFSPDEVLLRRFGLVRAIGGAAYFAAVAVLAFIHGSQVWPLALGVPVLAVVTTAYFLRSQRYPRTSVVVSLVADALVLGGAVAFVGGTGAGAVMLYAIPVVSAGVLLGPVAALGFTLFVSALSLLQFAAEEAGIEPILLDTPDTAERVTVLMISLALLASVGFLSAAYADRLHELIAEAAAAAEAARSRNRRRRTFVAHASDDVRAPLAAVEAVAAELTRASHLDDAARSDLAMRLRSSVTRLDAAVGLLADAGAIDDPGTSRPEPVLLRRAVADCVAALGERLNGWQLETDVPPMKVVGDPRAVRRIIFNLLENVVEHTPKGTRVDVTVLPTAGHAVLVVTDNGPGIPADIAAQVFEGDGADEGVGLPLVKELCAAVGADIRHEPVRGGGARFLVSFRLAPAAAPSRDDEAVSG